MAAYTLISFDLCPYVQRSVITLEEKGADYEIQYIDLSNKPDWFLKISPFGKVPVLRVEDTVLFESAVINEFLDEVAGERLHPGDPLRRAHNRAWIEFASAALIDVFRLMVAEDEDQATTSATKTRDKLQRFEEQLGDGPLFNGAAFSLVDAAAAPLLERLHWCNEIAELGVWQGLPKVSRWRDALLERDSVKNSTVPDIRDRFLEYLKGRGSPTRNVDPSWLGTRAAAQ